MPTTTGTTGGTSMMTNNWPAARVLAMIGGVIGLIMALLLLMGSMVGVTAPTADVPIVAGAGLLGAMGVIHLVVSLLVIGSAWAMMGNPRVHGALLVLWGVIGIFLGFGFWIGAVLVIIGGVLALVRMPVGGGTMGRRPVV